MDGASLGRKFAWMLTALAVSIALPAMVRADTELGHSGAVGRHRLVDIYDSPGAVCDIVLPGNDSLGETWLRINPPVMFARDRSDAVDRQAVGWRAIVSARDERSGAWRVVRRSAIAQDEASDSLASYFNGQGWLAGFPVSQATYTVSVEMLWYTPDNPDRIEGRAIHGIEYFTVFLRANGEVTHGRTASVCSAPR